MKKVLLLLFMAVSLSSCASLFVTSASTVAFSTIQERTFDDAVDDTYIKLRLNNAWMSEDWDIYKNCSMTVSEGRVLLTGVVENDEAMKTAVKLTWQIDGVKEVINEIIIREEGKSFLQSSTDAYIATKIRTKILASRDILSINYSIDVNDSNVYLIGIAQNQDELDKVIDIARNTGSVESVVSYIKLKKIDE
ncbi:MAG: BON domain-containing protein [Alphaproteobacteria bacterium]|nr:BON domain-containing protein [Alphaproteobacteria bacterium]MCV6599697.1 BON domain-containing protein [Alphaproteobacteria bacterium]